MNRLLLFFVFLFSSFFSFAQDASTTARQQQFQESSFIPGNFTRELLPPPAGLTGSFYLSEEWHTGAVYLFNKKSYSNMQLKYDLKNEVLEINMPDFSRVLPISQVQAFKWIENGQEKFYMNTSTFAPKGAPSTGFFKILIEGKAILASKARIEIVKANYNIAMNLGEKDDQIKKVESYYLIKDDKPQPLSRKKKEFWAQFDDQEAQVKSFAESNRLNIHSESDLARIVTYYNSIMK